MGKLRQEYSDGALSLLNAPHKKERRKQHGRESKVKDGRGCKGRIKEQGTALQKLREQGRSGTCRLPQREKENETPMLRKLSYCLLR